jgi:hypothetical protein
MKSQDQVVVARGLVRVMVEWNCPVKLEISTIYPCDMSWLILKLRFQVK